MVASLLEEGETIRLIQGRSNQLYWVRQQGAKPPKAGQGGGGSQTWSQNKAEDNHMNAKDLMVADCFSIGEDEGGSWVMTGFLVGTPAE